MSLERKTRKRLMALVFRSLLATACGMACDPPTDPPQPVQLGLEASVRPLGVPGWPLLDTIAVEVRDSSGHPRARLRVDWSILLGGGSIEVLDSLTVQDGSARAVWTLGPAVGPNRLRVAALNDTLTLEAWGTAFTADRLDSDASLGCGLRSGDLWCWPWPGGASPYSAGPTLPFGTTFPGPSLVASGRSFTAVAVSGGWACGLLPTQSVECYERGGTTIPMTPALPAMRALAGSGQSTICGLAAADSTPWCWDPFAGVGSEHHIAPSPPLLDITVDEGTAGVVGIACGRQVDSTAVCWGHGAVGDSTVQDRALPVPVAGGLTFRELASGHGFACGLRSNGETWCWGRNTYRALGSGGGDALAPRVAATGISKLRAAAYTVGVLQGSQVARWGQFQFGDPAGNPLTPLAPFDPGQVQDFAGDDLSCLWLSTGEVTCYHELWIFSSTLAIDTYLPVQPVPQQTRVRAGP